MRSGQDVALVGPRRTGKSSLVRRAADEVRAEGILVAECDLFFTPSKERLAQHLARAIYGSLATVEDRLERRLGFLRAPARRSRAWRSIRRPAASASRSGWARARRMSTRRSRSCSHCPGASPRSGIVRSSLVLDEFQEVLALDADLPRLFRSVFQTQPGGGARVPGQPAFADATAVRRERRTALPQRPHGRARAAARGLARAMGPRAVRANRTRDRGRGARAAARRSTRGHPYQTQELLSFTWARTPEGAVAGLERGRDGAPRRGRRREPVRHRAVGRPHTGGAPRPARARARAGPRVRTRVPEPAWAARRRAPPSARSWRSSRTISFDASPDAAGG